MQAHALGRHAEGKRKHGAVAAAHGMGVHDALGLSGRAAGIDDVEARLRRDLDRRRHGTFRCHPGRNRLAPSAAVHRDMLQIAIGLALKRFRRLLIKKEVLCARINDHRGHLLASRRIGDEPRNGACAQRADEHGDLHYRIEPRNRSCIAKADSICLKPRRDAIGKRVELLPCDPPIGVGNRRRIGALIGKGFDKGGKRRKVRRKQCF